tara:strand:- start:357 stop:1310 length:954 start_codon:yes stop_codon:yes gene_type:complete
MKKVFPIFLLFMILSCGSDDNNTPVVIPETYQERVTAILNQSPEANPLEDSSLFFSNLSYGSAERNTYDILLPEDGNPIGVVVFFHGGSFLFNDKSDAYEAPYESFIKILLIRNVAVVNVNYSYLNSPNSEGVITSLSDGTLLLNHIRSIASSINIDANKIILGGASSGAGIALWNGLQAEHNTGVLGVVAIETQSTYNLYKWESLFTDLSIDTIAQSSTEFQMLFSLFYGGVVPTQEQLDAVDFINFIDSTDPDLYLFNTAGNTFLKADGTVDLNVLYHSRVHTDTLRGKAIVEGLENSGAYQETPDAFVLRILGQ